jgi:hypothetical protein
MSKNCVFPGSSPAKSLPVPSGTKAGQPVKVGGFIGVCETDRNEGDGLDRAGNPTGYASVAPTAATRCRSPRRWARWACRSTSRAATRSPRRSGSNTLFGHTRPVIDKGVASGATKSADGGTAGYVNVELIRL